MRFAAKGALSNRGYAGKTQVGVMVWTGKIRVDHNMRYRNALRETLRAA